MGDFHPEEGQPGKPGEPPIGQQGGRGGEGGKGGEGKPEGPGGEGGSGGAGAKGEPGPPGLSGRDGVPKLLKWGLTIWIIAFSTVAIAMYTANRHRITDIDKSRVVSCERTYEGVREVLRPFFPPADKRTPKQQRDLDKFNTRVDRLKQGCEVQTDRTR